MNTMETQIKQFITDQLHMLDRGIVATPATRQRLDEFANANFGTNDVLLTQMAINFGYKIAIENLQEELKLVSND